MPRLAMRYTEELICQQTMGLTHMLTAPLRRGCCQGAIGSSKACDRWTLCRTRGPQTINDV